jgi:hypothetical protein
VGVFVLPVFVLPVVLYQFLRIHHGLDHVRPRLVHVRCDHFVRLDHLDRRHHVLETRVVLIVLVVERQPAFVLIVVAQTLRLLVD